MDLVFKFIENFALLVGTILELFVSKLTNYNTTQTAADLVKKSE